MLENISDAEQEIEDDKPFYQGSNPTCGDDYNDHEWEEKWSGIKCKKCTAWFCY